MLAALSPRPSSVPTISTTGKRSGRATPLASAQALVRLTHGALDTFAARADALTAALEDGTVPTLSDFEREWDHLQAWLRRIAEKLAASYLTVARDSAATRRWASRRNAAEDEALADFALALDAAVRKIERARLNVCPATDAALGALVRSMRVAT